MQEVRLVGLVGCDEDCLNCKFSDCTKGLDYYQRYRETHKEAMRIYQREYSRKHMDKKVEYNRRQRIKEQLKRMKNCFWCESEIKRDVIKFERKFFCCEECISEYLIAKSRDKFRYFDKEELKCQIKNA